MREQLLEALPGYTRPDVYSRGADPEGCTYFFIDELESILRDWVAWIYHHIPIRTKTDANSNIDRDATSGRHPSQFPQPLRDALRGTSTRQRLERFVTLAHQPSINQAAQALGCNPEACTTS